MRWRCTCTTCAARSHPGIVRTVRGVGYALGAAEAGTMSLQRRLLVYLLLVRAAGLGGGAAGLGRPRAARGQRALRHRDHPPGAPGAGHAGRASATPGQALPAPAPSGGEADLRDLAIAVWNADGRLLLVDREGVQLPRRPDAVGLRRRWRSTATPGACTTCSRRGASGWWRPGSACTSATNWCGTWSAASCCPGCWCCRCCWWPWPGPCARRWRRCAR